MKRAFSHIGFSVGVTLLVANLLSVRVVAPIAVALAVLFVASLVLKRFRQAVSVPLCLGSALFACLLFIYVMSAVAVPQLALDGVKTDAHLYVTDSGTISEDGAYHYDAVVSDVHIDGAPQNIRVRLKSNSKLDAEPYRVIKANVAFYSLGNDALSSNGYWGKGVYLSAKLNSHYLTDQYHSSPMRWISNARRDIVSRLMLMLPDDRGALSVAMLIGDKANMSLALRDAFRLSGTTHIMAVSGLHLTAVTGMALLLMRLLRIKDKTSSIVTISLVLLYISLAGFTRSVVRAGIMMIVLCAGNLLGRRADSLNSLGLAVFIICLNPFAVYDVGALLSVLSVLSLIVLYPHFASRLPTITNMDSDRVSLALRLKRLSIRAVEGIYVSISVLLFTAPAMYLFFGYISVSGVLANIFVVPTASVMMPLALITYLFSLQPVNIITAVIARALGLLASFVISIVRLLSTIGGTTVALGNSFGIIVVGVLVILAFGFMLNSAVTRRAAIISCAIVMTLLTAVSGLLLGGGATAFVSSSGATVISDDDIVVVSGITDYSSYCSAYNYLASNGLNIDFLIIQGDSYYPVRLISRISTDTVLMSQFDDEVLSSNDYRDIQVVDEYNIRLCDHCVLHYSEDAYAVDTYDTSIGTAADSTISIGEGYILEPKGNIALADGGVVYHISNHSTYSVRRLREWQE